MSSDSTIPHRTDGAGPLRDHPRSPCPPQRDAGSIPLYYLFLFPSLTLFSLVVTLPAVVGFGYSFTNSVGFGDWEFIGLRNYIAMFRDQGILSVLHLHAGLRVDHRDPGEHPRLRPGPGADLEDPLHRPRCARST